MTPILRNPAKETELTPSQAAAFGAICALRAKDGVSPSLQEIANALGLTRATIQATVHILVRKGYIGRRPGKFRSLTVVRGFGGVR